MNTFSAWLAVAFGLFLAVAEAYRNWGDWQWWPFWVVDYFAAFLLILGGWRVLLNRSGRLLVGAWGFAAAMFYMSLFTHIEALSAGANETYASGALDRPGLTRIIAIMTFIAFIGLFTSLFRRVPR
ncbi:MAG: hypothetical protein AAFX03_11230 [Pseudomonadota bacterium]